MAQNHLPVEIIEEIIAELGAPTPSVLQYGTPSTIIVDTLRQLCLVNHFMHNISMPLLYSTIAIRNRHQHDALIYALHHNFSLGSYARDLWLELPGSPELIHNLLYLLGPNLCRLAISGATVKRLAALHHVSDALRGHCRKVEEFEHMQHLLAHENSPSHHPLTIGWPYMTKLHRLTLDHTHINDCFVKYIRRKPHLTHLTLLNPRWEEGSIDIFHRMLDDDGGLQSIHLVFLGASNVVPSVTYIVDRMAELRLAFGSIHRVPGMRVIAIVGDNELAAMEYAHSLISCGDIWSLASGFIEIEDKMVNISAF
jgi:hypothetical protein